MSPTTMTTALLTKIDNIRIGKGISVYKLSKMTGITEHAYFRWMRGENTPSLYNICSVLEVLGLEINITDGGGNNA